MPDTAVQRPDTRALVLEAALKLFTENGYFNTSVHDIGREAATSIGSIYHHFGDKTGIARALYEQLTQRMQQLISEVEQQADTCHDQARTLVARLFTLTEAEPRAMTFILYARHREFLPDEPPVCSSRPFVMMREMINRGISSGEVRDMDAMVAATCLFGGPLRMITARLDGVLEHSLPTYLDDVWACAWRSISKH